MGKRGRTLYKIQKDQSELSCTSSPTQVPVYVCGGGEKHCIARALFWLIYSHRGGNASFLACLLLLLHEASPSLLFPRIGNGFPPPTILKILFPAAVKTRFSGEKTTPEKRKICTQFGPSRLFETFPSEPIGGAHQIFLRITENRVTFGKEGSRRLDSSRFQTAP